MSDSAIVFSSFGYLIVVALLLNYAGYNVGTPTVPGGNPVGIDSNGAQTSGKNVIATVADCSVNVALDLVIVIPVVSFLVTGHNPFDATAAACDQSKSSPLGDLISNVINGITVSVTFLYQLITFSIPGVPVILDLLIILPPGLVLVYIGFKLIRGIGG